MMNNTAVLSARSLFLCNPRLAVCLVLIFFQGTLISAAQPPALLPPGAFPVPQFPETPPKTALQEENEIQLRQFLQQLRGTEESIAAGNWVVAAERFDSAWQSITEGEDPVVAPGAEDRPPLLPGSNDSEAGGRARMESLFFSSPVAFRNEYLSQTESRARQALQAAMQSGLVADLERVALRYRFCASGTAAGRLLSRIAVDRGEYLEAALQLFRVVQSQPEPDPQIQLQTALVAWKAGLNSDAIETLRELVQESPGKKLELGSRALTVPQDLTTETLTAFLENAAAGTGPAMIPDSSWTQPFGSYRRISVQSRGPVGLTSRWSDDLFNSADILYQKKLTPLLEDARDIFRQINMRRLIQNRTVVPVPSPLIIGDKVIYRTIAGVRAADVNSGELLWETTHPDGRLLSLAESRLRAVAGDGQFPSGSYASAFLAEQLFNQLTRTNTAGQLSSNGKTLFVIEDSSSITWNRDIEYRPIPSTQLPANYVRAYDVETGLLKWEAGGQRGSASSVNELTGFYFLGAPLVIGERTYVLAESGEGIFLIQIGDPAGNAGSPSATNPEILHSQLISIPVFPVQAHPVRKHAGLVPSFAQGLLICPTCDERIVAISAKDHSIRWVFQYSGTVTLPDLGEPLPVLAGARDSSHSDLIDFEARWVDSLPRIHERRILITPRDTDEIYCLDLSTGQELWRAPRGVSRGIAAVQDDSVVLFGNSGLTALSLEDGHPVWTSVVREGQVCGHPAVTDKTVTLPTSAPALETFELETGRHLVTRRPADNAPPGNLLCIGNRLFSQNLTTLSVMEDQPVDAENMDMMQNATDLLLQAKVTEAVELLDQLVASAPDSDVPRALLIEVLLESLRTDYSSASARIPRLRELISRTTADQKQSDFIVSSMLGLNLADAAVLPGRLEAMDRSGQQLDTLFQLTARGLEQKKNATADELIQAIDELIPALSASRERVITTGYLQRRSSQLMIASIRSILSHRSAAERKQIEQGLTERLLPRLKTILAPPDGDASAGGSSIPDSGTSPANADELDAPPGSRPDPTPESKRTAEAIQLIRDLQAAGLNMTALRVAETSKEAGIELPQLLREQLLTSLMADENADLSGVLKQLLNEWKSAGDRTAVQTLHQEAQIADAGDPRASMLMPMRKAPVVSEVIEEWAASNDVSLKASSSWQGQPVVEESDERASLPPNRQGLQGPQSNIPLFGPPGLFRGWSFAQKAHSTAIIAYDGEGFVRWSFEPQVVITPQETGLVSEKYITAAGHLLAVKLHDQLYLLDSTAASGDHPPRLLWELNLGSLHRDQEAAAFRQFIPGWERLSSYAAQLNAWYPCGPMTGSALPVIAGRRLFVFDPLTGDRLWQLDGISQDTLLLGTQETLIVLSETSRQVEVRRIADGELLRVSKVPDWWIDANENVGSSVQDIDVEQGMNLWWRILVEEDSCVLFRLSAGESALESRNVVSDEVEWTIRFPQNSVFSNVAEDMVAVLSEGTDLRIVRVDTGTVLTHLKVNQVPDPRALYLRPSHGRLIVLPEAVDDPSLDLDPIGSGLHVYGTVWAIDSRTMQLSWEKPLRHCFLRMLFGQHGPILPNAPVLVLLTRDRKTREGALGFVSVYGCSVLDVRTGEELYGSDDVGRTLSWHWMDFDASTGTIDLSFDARIVTFLYPKLP